MSAAVTIVQAAPTTKPQSWASIVRERFFEHRLAAIGLGVIFVFCSIALGADLISHWMGILPDAQDILNRYALPSREHWLGTDEAGRDALIRLVYGTRVSLGVAMISAIASTILGLLVGMVAGYYGGFLDNVLMRVTDALLALPILPIMIILAAIDFGKIPILAELLRGEDSSVLKMILILVLFSWMTQARLVRGAVLSLRHQDYVVAARTLGASDLSILVQEILPNVVSPVIVSVTLTVGQSILFEAALSFLGLGIQPPTASWGNMLNNALEVIYNAPHLVMVPGFLIFLVVVSFNFVGDSLQDALDPKAIRR